MSFLHERVRTGGKDVISNRCLLFACSLLLALLHLSLLGFSCLLSIKGRVACACATRGPVVGVPHAEQDYEGTLGCTLSRGSHGCRLLPARAKLPACFSSARNVCLTRAFLHYEHERSLVARQALLN